LAQRLCGFEAVSGGERHAPVRDLARLEIGDRARAEDAGGFGQQPAQLGGRLRLRVVLGEVLVGQLSQRDGARAQPSALGTTDRALERDAGRIRARKAATL
jgi:hypothetical protein